MAVNLGDMDPRSLLELYGSIFLLDYEIVISVLSFIALLVWCFSDRKSKKYEFAESCSIPLLALLLFKYFVLFYGMILSPADTFLSSYFPFGKVHIVPRLACLFLDMISGCGFFSIFYRYDTKFRYNGLEILSSVTFPYMVILEFFLLEMPDMPSLYPALDTGVAIRVSIYLQCLVLLYTVYLLLMQWKKKDPGSNMLPLFDGFLDSIKNIYDLYFAPINKKNWEHDTRGH